jgi:hypothetical protein
MPFTPARIVWWHITRLLLQEYLDLIAPKNGKPGG